MEMQKALYIGALVTLTSMLLGGFYIQHLPFWLKWSENLSFITYSYQSVLQLEFTDDQRFRYVTCSGIMYSAWLVYVQCMVSVCGS